MSTARAGDAAAMAASTAAVDVDGEGEGVQQWPKQLKLTCEISQGRLIDPARGEDCKHLATCNYDALRSAVQRVNNARKECPVAGCSAPLRLVRHIERDDKLKRALEGVPPEVNRVWVDGEGRIVTAVVEQQTARRGSHLNGKRRRASLDVSSDGPLGPVEVDEERRRYWAEQACKVKREH